MAGSERAGTAAPPAHPASPYPVPSSTGTFTNELTIEQRSATRIVVAPQARPPVTLVAPVGIPLARAKPRRSYGTFLRIIAVLALASVAYGTYVFYGRRQPYEWAGRVEARTVGLGSRLGGRVKNVLVHEGDEVKEGQVLIELEPGDLEARQAAADADVAHFKAELDKLLKGSRQEELAQASAKLAEARATMEQASTTREQATRQLARVSPLSGLTVSAADYDVQAAAAKAAGGLLNQTAATTASAEAALRLLRNGAREEDVRSMRATLAASQANVQALVAQAHELVIRAPADARVESLTVLKGDILAPNATAATILQSDQLFVVIYIPEPLIGKIAVGNNVPISVDSFPNRLFPGHVDHINQVGEFTPRNLQTVEERADEVFAARISVIEGQKDLRAGMAAFIRVPKKR